MYTDGLMDLIVYCRYLARLDPGYSQHSALATIGEQPTNTTTSHIHWQAVRFAALATSELAVNLRMLAGPHWPRLRESTACFAHAGWRLIGHDLIVDSLFLYRDWWQPRWLEYSPVCPPVSALGLSWYNRTGLKFCWLGSGNGKGETKTDANTKM